MNRSEFKRKPQHLVTEQSGEIKKIVNSANTEIGTSTLNADLRVFGTMQSESGRITTLTNTLGVSYVDQTAFGHRLSLVSNTPITTGSVTDVSNLYLTPYLSNKTALYDGTRWLYVDVDEITFALSGLTTGKNYDIFLYLANSVPTIELSTAWTNDTTRATALTRQNGVLVKSGDATRRYVGTIRATAATTTTDSTSKRFVWNQYNRQLRTLLVQDATNSWTYGSTTYRQARATTTNRFEYVTGDDSCLLSAETRGTFFIANTAQVTAGVGVGIDSTTTSSGQLMGPGETPGVAFLQVNGFSRYHGYPGLGYHAINWLESGNTDTGTEVAFCGDCGQASVLQSGMFGEIMA